MQILFSKHVFVFYFHIYGKQVLLSKMLMVLLAAVIPFFFFWKNSSKLKIFMMLSSFPHVLNLLSDLNKWEHFAVLLDDSLQLVAIH